MVALLAQINVLGWYSLNFSTGAPYIVRCQGFHFVVAKARLTLFALKYFLNHREIPFTVKGSLHSWFIIKQPK